MEEHLRTLRKWNVCFLHTNELPLRHLIEYLDGKTCSDLGIALNDAVELEVDLKFKPITNGEPLIILDDHII